MRVQRTRHTRAYVQIPNEIARHQTLSLEARGLLTYLLSLPDANGATVERITERTPNGRRSVSVAMNELVAAGYVKRARMQDPETGRWVTLTSVTDSPTNHMPTVGAPTGPAVGASPTEKDAGCNDLPTPAREELRPVGRDGSEEEGEKSHQEKSETPLSKRATKALLNLATYSHRLILSPREARRLAPQAGAWLASGLSEAEMLTNLSSALPSEITSAAALVAYRLKNHQPEPCAAPSPSQAPSQASARQSCPECEVIFPLGHPGGICRSCR